jgi:hypothetical protein
MRTSVLLVLAAACTSPSGLDRDIEPQVTVTQGIYGQLSSLSDSGQPTAAFAAGKVTVYDQQTVAVHMFTTSNQDGVYQMWLETGTYFLCALDCTPLDNNSCCTLAFVPDGRVRRDYEANIGGGDWCTSGTCPDD